MIRTISNKLHWNYFITLENDLEIISRYVEFSEDNLATYSIELAHILFASASEVDVIAKLLCSRLKPNKSAKNIDQYRSILLEELPDITQTEIAISCYGLILRPWDNWSAVSKINPKWWHSYNNVKHERNVYYKEASLKNALNAMGALLILLYYYYGYDIFPEGLSWDPKAVTRELEPKSSLLKLPDEYYNGYLLI